MSNPRTKDSIVTVIDTINYCVAEPTPFKAYPEQIK